MSSAQSWKLLNMADGGIYKRPASGSSDLEKKRGGPNPGNMGLPQGVVNLVRLGRNPMPVISDNRE